MLVLRGAYPEGIIREAIEIFHLKSTHLFILNYWDQTKQKLIKSDK